MKSSIKKNYILNLIYELFALLVPIFVMPYISRNLGASGIGVYSYTYSIVYYFMLLGALGFTTYARRELSKIRDNKDEQNRLFWEITIIKFITCLISCIIYEIIIFVFFYNTYYFIFLQSIIIYIIGTSFDIIYYYQANEEFDKIVYKNIFIKLLGVLLIFLFVKKNTDLHKYIVIQSLIFTISNLLLWITLPKSIFKTRIKKINVKKHIIPALKLFIPTVASSIYTVLDKTLIGVMITDKTIVNGVTLSLSNIEIGVYEQVEKLIKMVITLLTSLSTIISPRNSYYYEKKEYKKIELLTFKTYSYVMLLSLPMIFGIILISNQFCPLFFGAGYEKAPIMMNILAVLILLISLSGVFGMQYLTAIGKDNRYIISVSTGAFVNIILNIILIPKFLAFGAAMATVISELIILVLLISFSREIVNIKTFFKTFIKYLIGSLIMFFCVNSLNVQFTSINILLKIFISITIYFIYLIMLKDRLTLEIMETIFKRLKKLKGN